MLKKSRFSTTLLSLGLAAGLAGWSPAQAAESAPPTAKPLNPNRRNQQRQPNRNGGSPPASTGRKPPIPREEAYVLGILNMAMVEYQLTGPNPKHRTTVPSWSRPWMA